MSMDRIGETEYRIMERCSSHCVRGASGSRQAFTAGLRHTGGPGELLSLSCYYQGYRTRETLLKAGCPLPLVPAVLDRAFRQPLDQHVPRGHGQQVPKAEALPDFPTYLFC